MYTFKEIAEIKTLKATQQFKLRMLHGVHGDFNPETF